MGETHAAIARHKVAVLRERVPLLYATDQSEVVAAFEDHASQLQSPTYAVGREILWKIAEQALLFQVLSAVWKS